MIYLFIYDLLLFQLKHCHTMKLKVTDNICLCLSVTGGFPKLLFYCSFQEPSVSHLAPYIHAVLQLLLLLILLLLLLLLTPQGAGMGDCSLRRTEEHTGSVAYLAIETIGMDVAS